MTREDVIASLEGFVITRFSGKLALSPRELIIIDHAITIANSKRKTGDTFVFETAFSKISEDDILTDINAVPCKVVGFTGTKEMVSKCEESEAEFWSVEATFKNSHPLIIADCESKIAAINLVNFLTSFKTFASF